MSAEHKENEKPVNITSLNFLCKGERVCCKRKQQFQLKAQQAVPSYAGYDR